jgi:hypothetical protein
MSEALSLLRLLSVCYPSPGAMRYLFGALLRRQNVCRDVSTSLWPMTPTWITRFFSLYYATELQMLWLLRSVQHVPTMHESGAALCAEQRQIWPQQSQHVHILYCLAPFFVPTRKVYDIPIVPVWNFLYKHTPHETPNITHYHNQKCKQKS